jgi:MFS family permease
VQLRLPPSPTPRHPGIAAHDATVVSIALPTIGRDFLTSLAARQWVMNGYTLTLAAFLLIGGRSATGSAGGRSI